MYNDYEILNTDEVMDYLGIGRNTMYELLKEKKIKAFKIGKVWKIPKEALDEYVTRECE